MSTLPILTRPSLTLLTARHVAPERASLIRDKASAANLRRINPYAAYLARSLGIRFQSVSCSASQSSLPGWLDRPSG
jgi:hypothetical protein